VTFKRARFQALQRSISAWIFLPPGLNHSLMKKLLVAGKSQRPSRATCTGLFNGSSTDQIIDLSIYKVNSSNPDSPKKKRFIREEVLL
jgi:hypothetical protein